MPTFMETCCCAGHRPEGVVSRRHLSRSDLVARLLRDRRVARFIVAPTGFGKSCLAFEYANMVFAFQNVFWVNARSPCFLRDLDADALLPSLYQLDPCARLVVFEDIPRLDNDRTSAFCALVDELLRRKVEVVVTCVPSTDSFSLLQRDRVLVMGRDLLLGDDEMQREVIEGRCSADRLAGMQEADRIACLHWADNGPRSLALGMRGEELPGSIRLAMLAFLVLRQGHVDDLSQFLPAELAHEAVSILSESYPLFGIDMRTSTFSATRLSFDVLADAFATCMDDMVASSLLDSKESLCKAFARSLLSRRDAKEACSFMAAFATKPCTAQWLACCGWEVITCPEPASFCELRAQVLRSSAGFNDQLSSLGGWAAYALGDASSALAQARRVVRSGSARTLDKVRSAVLWAVASAGESRARALGELGRLVDGVRAGKADSGSCDSEEAFDWACAARVVLAQQESLASGVGTWVSACAGQGTGEPSVLSAGRAQALMLSAAWLMASCAELVEEEGADSSRGKLWDVFASDGGELGDLERLARFVGDALDHVCLEGKADWCAIRAALALERLSASLPRLAAYLPALGVMAHIHRGETGLFAQQDEYRRMRAASLLKRQEFQLTHPDAFRKNDLTTEPAAAARTGVPMMQVTLFGGLEVRLGEQMIDPRAFNRQKTRTLLALLVLSRGREMTRDRLATLLWPDSGVETARRNLYSTWSQLRRALTVEGSCPYLIRSQSGFRLDVRLVTSDAFEFESLCRSLMFGNPESEDWERLYTQVSGSYGDDLMPCEEKNEVVDALRGRYRMQLVDGMIAASKRLLLQGEPRGSLWFARAALERDRTREDAYVTLMEAQIGADQRGMALDTYFACRKFLTEELGIDPSPYLVSLYRSIIETEEVLV